MENKKRLVLDEVIIDNINLDKPIKNKNGYDPKFSVRLIIKFFDTYTINNIKKTMNDVSVCAFGVGQLIQTPLYMYMKTYDYGLLEFRDNVMTVNSKSVPEIIDHNSNRFNGKLLGGMHVKATIEFSPYIINGKKGISAKLIQLQLLENQSHDLSAKNNLNKKGEENYDYV